MNTLEKVNIEENFLILPQRGISLFIKNKKSGISLKNSFIISTLLHPILLFMLLFLIFQTSAKFIEKTEQKTRDIEFVIVNSKKTHKKIRKLEASPAEQKSKPQSKTIIPFSKKHHKGSKLPENITSDTFAIPMPKINPLSSDIGFGADGPVGYTSPGSSSTSLGDGTGGQGRRKGNGSSFGTGGVGSPKISNSSNYFDGILKDPDLTPYITNLQRKIKKNWTPPKGDDNKIVVLFLRIAKNGKILVLNVKNTSSNPDIDNAAIAAVKRTLPFQPLPIDFKENYLDVVFNFDYNVLSVKSN